MRISFFLLFLVLALPLWASTSLYDALHNLPSTYVSQPKVESQDPLGTEENFQEALYEHWMIELLQPQYRVYDPNLDRDYIVRDVVVNDELSGEMKLLVEDTLYTQVMLISAVGGLVLMPESFSNWDLDELQEKSLGERWVEHVTTKPVWDVDDWPINYIGHPISGAVYYSMARNDGMDIFESALYSTIMSTFFWEYGYEAFAEIPSIQDLIVTPFLGSILGEGWHMLEIELDKNGGKVWGSQGLGSFAYFWLDPMGSIAGGLSDIFDISVKMEYTSFDRYQDPSHFRYSNEQANPVRFQDRDYGFMLTFY